MKNKRLKSKKNGHDDDFYLYIRCQNCLIRMTTHPPTHTWRPIKSEGFLLDEKVSRILNKGVFFCSRDFFVPRKTNDTPRPKIKMFDKHCDRQKTSPTGARENVYDARLDGLLSNCLRI